MTMAAVIVELRVVDLSHLILAVFPEILRTAVARVFPWKTLSFTLLGSRFWVRVQVRGFNSRFTLWFVVHGSRFALPGRRFAGPACDHARTTRWRGRAPRT